MRAQKSKRSQLPKPGNCAVPAGSQAQSTSLEILRLEGGAPSRRIKDAVAREEPLEIRVKGRSVAVTMRTPGHDLELAAGFLLSEGIIHRSEDIIEIAPCAASDVPDNTLNVFMAAGVDVDFARLTRHVFASSSCGLCGKASIDEVHQHFPPVTSKASVSRKLLGGLPDEMRKAQPTFARTGGLHAAAIFDFEGHLLALREDVGRHNALDKTLGWALRQNLLPLDHHVLLVSGRASFEILQKSLAGGIPIVAAISAPSSLAVEFARESGQTLVGFLRGDTMNVYAGAGRIAGLSQKEARIASAAARGSAAP
jgi:FdhD protein